MSRIFSSFIPSVSPFETVVGKFGAEKEEKEKLESEKVKESLLRSSSQILSEIELEILVRIQYLSQEIPLCLLEFVLSDINLDGSALVELVKEKLISLRILGFDSKKLIVKKSVNFDLVQTPVPKVNGIKHSVFQACATFIESQSPCESNYRLLLQNLITAARHVLVDSETTQVVAKAMLSRLNDVVAFGLGNEAKNLFQEIANKMSSEDAISERVSAALAKIHHDQGDCAKALEMYNSIVSYVEEAPSGFAQHSSKVVWEAKLGAATVLLSLGRYQEAWKVAETVLQEQELSAEVLVDGAALLLKTHGVIAGIMSRLGRFADTLETLEHIASKQDPESRDWLWTQQHIAITKSNGGESHEAIALYGSIYAKLVVVLGTTHTDVLGLLVNKALAQKYVGEKIQALYLLKRVLKVRRENFGDDHPETLRTLINIAEVYIDIGRLVKSDKILNQLKESSLAVALRVEFLRISHSLCLIAQKRESIPGPEGASVDEENVDNAKDVVLADMFKVFTESRQVLGINHPFTLRVAHNAAGVYATRGSYDLAIELFDRVKILQTELLGEKHPEVLLTDKNISRCNKLKKMALKKSSNNIKDGTQGDDTRLEILQSHELQLSNKQSLFVL